VIAMPRNLRLLAVALLVVIAGCGSAPAASTSTTSPTPTATPTPTPTAEPPTREDIRLKENGTIDASYLNRSAATLYRYYAAPAKGDRPCPTAANDTKAAIQCSAAYTPVDIARQTMHAGAEGASEQSRNAAIAYAISVYTIVNESVEWKQFGPNSRLDERLTPAAKHEFDTAFGFLVLANHELRMNSPVGNQTATGAEVEDG